MVALKELEMHTTLSHNEMLLNAICANNNVLFYIRFVVRVFMLAKFIAINITLIII